MQQSFKVQPRMLQVVPAVGWCCVTLAVVDLHGGGFVNLQFDLGVYPEPPFGFSQPSDKVLPGWTARLGNTVQSEVGWNAMQVDSASVGVYSAGPLWGSLFEGRYGVGLVGGFEYPSSGPSVPASISQTGLIPGDASSLVFRASFGGGSVTEVRMDGEVLPLVLLGQTGPFQVYGVDVTGFAGQEAELSFVNHGNSQGTGGYLDSLSFSPSTVPEPSTWALMAVGALVLCWRVRGCGSRRN